VPLITEEESPTRRGRVGIQDDNTMKLQILTYMRHNHRSRIIAMNGKVDRNFKKFRVFIKKDVKRNLRNVMKHKLERK
jgi:hypothetical protein